jgi:hypothetical protein
MEAGEMKRYNPHRWAINAFTDGSGVWLVEWRDSVTYRCHEPDGRKSAWELDKAYPQFRGWKNETNRLEYGTAMAILKCWREDRKK